MKAFDLVNNTATTSVTFRVDTVKPGTLDNRTGRRILFRIILGPGQLDRQRFRLRHRRLSVPNRRRRLVCDYPSRPLAIPSPVFPTPSTPSRCAATTTPATSRRGRYRSPWIRSIRSWSSTTRPTTTSPTRPRSRSTGTAPMPPPACRDISTRSTAPDTPRPSVTSASLSRADQRRPPDRRQGHRQGRPDHRQERQRHRRQRRPGPDHHRPGRRRLSWVIIGHRHLVRDRRHHQRFRLSVPHRRRRMVPRGIGPDHGVQRRGRRRRTPST